MTGEAAPPSPTWARVGQRVRRWQFLLFQRHRHDRLVLEQVAGKPLLVLPQVLNPALFHTGRFMAEALNSELVPPASAVLDMGTGSGVGALFAARWARRVVAVDINPAAARCARINVLLHELEDRVEVRQGDLFGPVAQEKFDVVLFNPPFLRGRPRSDLDRALWATDVIERFAAGLPAHLAPGGWALILLSSMADSGIFLEAFRNQGLTHSIAAQRDLTGERLTIYRIALP